MTDLIICDRVDHWMGQVTEMERSNPERGTPAGQQAKYIQSLEPRVHGQVVAEVLNGFKILAATK